MTDVLVKPAFQSAYVDSGDVTKFGPNAWNAARLFSGGTVGDILTRDTGSATGASWTASPTLTGVAITAPSTGIATLGGELLDGTGWTSTGWTGSFNAFTHTAGNTSPLSRAIAGIAAGNFYQIAITISGSTAGSVTLTIGGTLVDHPIGVTLITGNATFAFGPQTIGTADFVVTPTTTFDGAVALSVKRITAAAASSIVLRDSTGTVSALLSNSLVSLRNLALGGQSEIVGYAGGGSLSFVTTGAYNTAFGPNAPLASNTSGTYNTAIGGGVLRSNTTGWYNTAIGDDAMAFNTTGYNNSAVGVDALYQNTSGANNTAVGFQSLLNNTTGSTNTAVGQGTLSANVSGSANVAVGTGALNKATGSNSVAVGSGALLVAISGSANTAVGQQALTSVVSGQSNVAVGTIAGFANTASQNVYIGYGSGYTETAANANVSGANNTYVGYQAGPGTTSQLANATGLGMQAHPTASNTVVIGNGSVTDVYFGSVTPAAKAHASLFQTETALLGAGGGATPTFITVGGSGPAAAAQNGWLKALDSTGATIWIPVWK